MNAEPLLSFVSRALTRTRAWTRLDSRALPCRSSAHSGSLLMRENLQSPQNAETRKHFFYPMVVYMKGVLAVYYRRTISCVITLLQPHQQSNTASTNANKRRPSRAMHSVYPAGMRRSAPGRRLSTHATYALRAFVSRLHAVMSGRHRAHRAVRRKYPFLGRRGHL